MTASWSIFRPGGRPSAHRGRAVVWGTDMSVKEKLLFAWLLMWMVVTFLLNHFWSFTVYALQKMVAFGVLPLLLSKLAAGVAGISFLC